LHQRFAGSEKPARQTEANAIWERVLGPGLPRAGQQVGEAQVARGILNPKAILAAGDLSGQGSLIPA
jgi:hypothetical protein